MYANEGTIKGTYDLPTVFDTLQLQAVKDGSSRVFDTLDLKTVATVDSYARTPPLCNKQV